MEPENIKKIMELLGETRGIAVKSHADFIVKEKGEEALQELEKTMAEMGYPTQYKQIKAMDFYPIGLEVATLLVIKELFGFGRKEMEEMGAFESKSSLLVRVFMKYFISLETAAKQVSSMWGKNYTIGKLRVREINQKERRGSLILENFNLHPIHCQTLEGYFASVVKMVQGGENVSCEEVKCPFRGDEYHEFIIKW